MVRSKIRMEAVAKVCLNIDNKNLLHGINDSKHQAHKKRIPIKIRILSICFLMLSSWFFLCICIMADRPP